MHFEQLIERKKREYTDKYVVVDASRPELARFRDAVGQVKTVNMSGRALVEFMDYHLNVGWYDIDPEFLKVVDKPPPKVEKPAAKKPAAKAEAKPAAAKEPTTKAPAAAKAGKPSVADILAAARAGKAGAAPAAAPASGEAALAAGTAATAPAPAAKPATKVDRSKMSVADMIAAARAGGAGTEPTKAPAATAPLAAKPPAEVAAPQAEAPEAEPVAAPVATAPTAAKSTEKVDKSKMSIDDMVTWCRAHDTK